MNDNDENDFTAETQRRREDYFVEPDSDFNELTHAVIGAAMEIHRELGPGYLEGVYEHAMCVELALRGIPFVRQRPFPVVYKGQLVGEGRLDLLVREILVVELKAVDALLPVHKAQALHYLKALDLPLALLINFKVPILRAGVQRIVRSR